MEMITRRLSGLTYQTNDITTVNLRIFLYGNPGEMIVSGGISILMIYIYNLTIVFPRPAQTTTPVSDSQAPCSLVSYWPDSRYQNSIK